VEKSELNEAKGEFTLKKYFFLPNIQIELILNEILKSVEPNLAESSSNYGIKQNFTLLNRILQYLTTFYSIIVNPI
jgi:hypothetical protein